MRNTLLLIIVLVNGCISGVEAQDLSFRNYSTLDGMSSSQVYQVMQDKNGDMLFSTDRGITKYDGTDFETFDLSHGLTNTTVFNFFPQEDGRIWCSTIDNSWFYFYNGTTHFIPCEQNELIKKHSNGGHVQGIWISETGDMYFGFEEIQDYLKIGKSGNQVIHPLEKRWNINDSLRVVFVEKENGEMFTYHISKNVDPKEWGDKMRMVIKQDNKKIGYKRSAFINRTFLFSSDKFLIIQNDSTGSREIQFESKVIGIGSYDQSHFWVGLYEGGIRILDMAGNEVQRWLDGKSATFLYKDNNGGIWISTLTDGVYYAQNDKVKQYATEGNNYIMSISSGKNGEPVVSTLRNHYQINEHTLNRLLLHGNGSGQKVLFDQEDDVYRFRLFNDDIYTDVSLINGAAIIDFTENNDSTLVIASPFNIYVHSSKGFLEYTHPSRITSVEIAADGYLIGGYTGVNYVKNATHEIEKVHIPECSGRIKDIKRKGRYHFIATNENGLVRWQEKGNRILHITKAQGLASDLINEVFAETESILWVATNNGLDRIVFQDDQFSINHFGVEHGLLDNDVTDVYVFQDVVWIGTRSGLCSILNSQFNEKPNSVSINLFWKQLHVNGVERDIRSELELSYDENNLEINFHSAFFGGASRVKYRYKISDENAIWFNLNSRKILLNDLQEGAYNLIVQASIDGSNWSDNQINLTFEIEPPFYRTWWFRILLATALGGLIYLFFKMRFLIYNKTLVKEALRLVIRKLKPKRHEILIQEQGVSHRIDSTDVLFLKSDGNYLTIQLKDKKHVIRYKISGFADLVPDHLEYIRVHKSYVVRIDNISGKNADHLILGPFNVPIGKTYKAESKMLDEFLFNAGK